MLIFFDLDGTLEDSRQDMALSVNRVRARLGLAELDLTTARGLVNRGMDALTNAAFPELISSPADTARLRAVYEEDYLLHVTDHTVLYPEIAELLDKLAADACLAVYTNKPERISRELLQRLGVLRHFHSIIGGDSFAESKPSAGPMAITAEKASTDRSQRFQRFFMCGDTAADMQAAVNFNALGIWCAWGYLDTRPEPQGNFEARHPLEILNLVRENRT